LITGGGSLIVASSGSGATETITEDATYTGSTTINSGATLRLGYTGDAGVRGALGNTAVSIASGGALTFARDSNSSFPGTMSGSGVVNKQGSGKLTLTNTSSYTGATSITGGTFEMNGAITGVGNNVAVSTAGTLGGT